MPHSTSARSGAGPDTSWFTDSRLGMFVHFGLYSGAARHEWVRSFEQLDDQDYQRYFDHFDPDRFDAAELARAATDLGARYVVLTAKHHEGFALWDSAVSDYTSVRACGRDLIAEYVTAVRAAGLRVGLYFSLLDWHHPDFAVDYHHPLRGGDLPALNAGRDMARYRQFLHAQVRELLTGYGPIDLLFYDFTYPDPIDGVAGKTTQDWDSETLLATTRELQPGILVNNRLGLAGDYRTPEQQQPNRPLLADDGHPVVWEACHTINGSWGYHRDNLEFKDPTLLVRMLIESVANGGNLLLNVGPDGRGAITPRDRRTLSAVGAWVHDNAAAVYGAGPSPLPAAPMCLYTQRGDRLYVHVLSWPLKLLHLPELAGRVGYARLLHDGSEIRIHDDAPGGGHLRPVDQPAGTLSLELPINRPEQLVPVIELTLREAAARPV